MKFVKLVFDFYLNASIHIAFSVYAFLRITEIYFELPYNENVNYFIFFGTITGYNFVKYAGISKLYHKNLMPNLKIIQLFSFFCFFIFCYYSSLIEVKTFLFSIPFILLTVLYSVPFLSGFKKNLREVSSLKIIVVGFVWAGFTVFIPLVDVEKISFNSILLMLQRFLIVVVLIMPFDIRDIKYDAISLQTIPKKIGIEKTKKLGLMILVISLVLEYFIATVTTVKTPFMIFFFLLIIFLMNAKKDQSKYYSSFWVESLPIVWWLLLLS